MRAGIPHETVQHSVADPHAGDTEIRAIDPNAASGLIAAARGNGDRPAFPPFSAK